MSESRYTLAELDLFHAVVGLGAAWLASERRAELEQHPDRIPMREPEATPAPTPPTAARQEATEA